MDLPKSWKTWFAYIAVMLTLGMTALTYGFARLDPLPKGQEVAAQAKDQQNEESTELSREGQIETQKEDKGLEDEGINKLKDVNQVVKQEQEMSSKVINDEQNNTDKAKSKLTIKDFPSPAQVEPLRGVDNYFSENLNSYIFHAGRDYPLAEGAMIRATHGGKVTFAGADPILGQKVEIDCGEDWRVVYGGLDNLRVQQGEIIQKNDVLGQIGYYSGADGINDRTQLHYEVWQGVQPQGE